MIPYEFRFENERGATLLFYYTHCVGDADARSHIRMASNLGFARFDIWQGDRHVETGSGRFAVH